MIDIKMDLNTGEPVVGSDGDFQLVYGDEQIVQEIVFRLRTTKGDWLLSPDIGCDLEQFIGQPNITNTHLAMERVIINELTKDFLVPFPNVDVVDVSQTQILILIEFQSTQDDEKIVQIQGTFDLNLGTIYARSSFR